MEDIDYWRLAEELSIAQAALLVAGVDPQSLASEVEKLPHDSRPPRYEAAKHAIKSALLNDRVRGECLEELDYDLNGNQTGFIPDTVDVHRSVVNVDSLRAWLEERGFQSGFFFPATATTPDYLDKSHERFAPKLAAAVRAWLATENNESLKGRHPKQALQKWLRENAAEFGLTDDEGKPMETTIGEIAKIANWRPTGGAPKTPGQDAGDDVGPQITPENDETDIPF